MAGWPEYVEAEAEKILKTSIVIDTLADGPTLYTDDIKSRIVEMLARGFSGLETYVKTFDMIFEKLVGDESYRKEYFKVWDEAGVTVVSSTIGALSGKPFAEETVLKDYAKMTFLLDNLKDHLVKVVKAEDIERAFREGKKGIILNFQNLAHIGLDIEKLDFYYNLGVRVMQLTYNTRNYIGNGCTERRDEGLSYFGLEVVDKLNKLGVLIDLSHCGPKTSMDAIEASKEPVAFTHTFARKLNDHVRGKDDELLQAVAEKDGYIGVLAVAGFLTSKPTATLDDMLNHIEYIVNLVGVDHVGIGSDIGDRMPDELAKKLNEELLPQLGFKPEHRADYTVRTVNLEDWRLWPNIVKGLISRGYSRLEVKKIIGENFLRVFKRVVG